MFPLVFQQFVQLVIILGKGGFTGTPGAENKLIRFFAGFLEAGGVEVDTFLTVFSAAQDHLVPLADIPVFHYIQAPVLPENHRAVHPAFFRQKPFAVNLEILGIHGGAVVIVGGYAVHVGHSDFDVGASLNFCWVKSGP